MYSGLLSPTHVVPAGSSGSIVRTPATAPVRQDAIVFYLGSAYELSSEVSTEETLDVFLQRVVRRMSDEEQFSHSAVKSLPRAWRDL
jgi:hypothetical protein